MKERGGRDGREGGKEVGWVGLNWIGRRGEKGLGHNVAEDDLRANFNIEFHNIAERNVKRNQIGR